MPKAKTIKRFTQTKTIMKNIKKYLISKANEKASNYIINCWTKAVCSISLCKQSRVGQFFFACVSWLFRAVIIYLFCQQLRETGEEDNKRVVLKRKLTSLVNYWNNGLWMSSYYVLIILEAKTSPWDILTLNPNYD